MGWTVSKLNVDMGTDQVTLGLESTPIPVETIVLGFRAPETKGPSRAAQTLDSASREAMIAQAKQILADAANSL